MIEVLCHSSIRFTLNNSKKIYIDPYSIDKNFNDADIIFITHDHYDHFSEEDINKVRKDDTIIVLPNSAYVKAIDINFNEASIIKVEPNKKYSVKNINFETIPAYNTNKKFHPKENEWVGYILDINNKKYYIAGDTDITEENKKVVCDVALVPIGGTYTMTSIEAANLINEIKPEVAIPIHYGKIVGTKQDAIDFKNNLDKNIKCEILLN